MRVILSETKNLCCVWKPTGKTLAPLSLVFERASSGVASAGALRLVDRQRLYSAHLQTSWITTQEAFNVDPMSRQALGARRGRPAAGCISGGSLDKQKQRV